MENSKMRIYLIGGAILAGIVILVLAFFAFRPSKTNAPVSTYPSNVQSVIDHPVEKVDNWSTLVDSENFQISYSTTPGVESPAGDSFFITINAQPVVQVAEQAEQALLDKLGITKDYACQLPVIINVPGSVDEKLTGFNFGLSFCSDRIHIADVAKP